MKRVLSAAFALCLALLLAVPAFADGGGPVFTSYDVVCTKDTPYYMENWEKDGVMEKRGVFPAGTELTVYYEYEKNGVLYGNVQVDMEDEEGWVYVLVDDVELKNNVYSPRKEDELSSPRTVYVVAKEGVPMYTGPNKIYPQLITIPRGTKLTYTYSNDEYDYTRTWAYVTYLGRNGWINVYWEDTKNGVVTLPDEDENTEIWALTDGIKMYDGMSFGNIEDYFRDDWEAERLAEMHEQPDRVVGTLKAGKKYRYRYSHGAELGGTWYYVTAGLRSGWVYMTDKKSEIATPIPERQKKQNLVFEPMRLKLYAFADKASSAITVSLGRNTILDPEYETRTRGDVFYYETIQGKTGWYAVGDLGSSYAYRIDADEVGEYYRDTNGGEAAVPMYVNIRQTGDPVGTIPVGGKYTPLYHGTFEMQTEDGESSEYVAALYVRYRDVTGWVLENSLGTMDYAEDETQPQIDEEGTETTQAEPAGDETQTDAAAAEEEAEFVEAPAARRSLSPLQIVLCCVGAAVVLALTAAVTLALIRRRRKAAQISAAPEPEQGSQTEPEQEPQPPVDPE